MNEYMDINTEKTYVAKMGEIGVIIINQRLRVDGSFKNDKSKDAKQISKFKC